MGACWLACLLWDQLRLDELWSDRLPVSRQGTRWLNVFKTLVCYRLIDPGSEWRLHRQWYEQSAMGDLLGEDFGLVQIDKLYRCLDKLLPHKRDLFTYLRQRWQALFHVGFEVLLRSDQHLFRIGATGRRSAEIRLQSRQTSRLRAGGDRLDRDPGRFSVGL
jgi:hypothetical protein